MEERLRGEKEYRKTKGGICNIANICNYKEKNLMTLVTVTESKLIKIKKSKIMRKFFRFDYPTYGAKSRIYA